MTKPSVRDWHDRARSVQFRSQAFIDGRFVDAASGETFDKTSPIDGRFLAKVAACGTEDVDRAVAAARKAFFDRRWSGRAPNERKKVLQALAALIRTHRDELALMETLDMGKPIAFSTTVDIPGSANRFSGSPRPSTRSTTRWRRRRATRGHDHPRAVGRGRRRRAVELPAADGVLEDLAGAGRRQLGDPEARRAVAAHRRRGWPSWRPRPASPRACSTCCRASARPRARRSAATWMSTSGLHRLDRGRQVLPALLRRIEHEAGLAGVRRQVAQHRAGRRAQSRLRRAPHRLRHLVQPGRGLHRGLAPDRRGQDQGWRSSRRSWRSARR